MKKAPIHKEIKVLIAFLTILIWSTLAWPQSSTHYAIDFHVLSGGGGERGSSHYLLLDTLGQSSPIGISTSTNYIHSAGFWHAFLGTIVEPDIAVTPNPYDFQRIFLGQSSSATFTVSNPGSANLLIGNLTLTGDPEYSLPTLDDHCSNEVLLPGRTCTFQVVFSPGAFSLGKKTATVSIPSNDPESPLSFAIEGRGVRLMVNPEEGTIGSLVSIGGSGFGTKKGKALVGTAGLKVQPSSWSPTLIVGALTKALLPMAYDVMVRPKEPKGASEITEPEGFRVRVPEVTTADPRGKAGHEVTLEGRFFGTKKGKVQFETSEKLVTAKVTYWYMDGASGASVLRFEVPKGLAPGSYPLRVTNKVGFGTVAFTVTD
mgnify:CR=1 FL=1